MAWVAVDEDGREGIFDEYPQRKVDVCGEGLWSDYWCGPLEEHFGSRINLPKGSIKKLIGRDLTWNDEPVELKEN